MGPNGTNGTHGTQMAPMAPMGPKWLPMAPMGTQMAPNGSKWLPMAPNGTLWDPMAPYGTQWDPMAPYGTMGLENLVDPVAPLETPPWCIRGPVVGACLFVHWLAWVHGVRCHGATVPQCREYSRPSTRAVVHQASLSFMVNEGVHHP